MRPTMLRSGVILAALVLVPAAVLSQDTAEKTAEQAFKNIQVFQGKPADELRPTMSYMASALGVQCGFCHAQPFSADTKPEKATARMMIKMVYAINKDNFDGRNQINCYTCHQGHSHPNGALSVAADMPLGAESGRGEAGGAGRGGEQGAGASGRGGAEANLPSAQQLLDKYTAALGGTSALAGIKSEAVSGERVAGSNSTPEEVLRADGKLSITDGSGDNATKSGFDGTQFWSAGGRGARELSSDTVGVLRTDLGIYPGADLKAEGARVTGEQPVGDRTAYVVVVRSPNGASRYFFDTETGLLLRIATSTPTYVGSLPLQVDYSDYRAVDGVKLPFDIQWSTHERTWERKVSAVKLNGAVAEESFTAPKQ